MAALTGPISPTQRIRPKADTQTYAIKDGSTVYQGSYVAIESATGRIVPFADSAGLVELGRVVEFDSPLQSGGSATGNTAGTVKAVVDIKGGVLERVPVTGASAETDVGTQVYLSTDNPSADLDVAATVNTKVVGEIVRFYSATEFDVLLYDHESIRGL